MIGVPVRPTQVGSTVTPVTDVLLVPVTLVRSPQDLVTQEELVTEIWVPLVKTNVTQIGNALVIKMTFNSLI